MPRRPVLNMHNGETNGKVNVDLNKRIPVDMDALVTFVIHSRQVSEG